MADEETKKESIFPQSVKRKVLDSQTDTYSPTYIRNLRALYEGGEKLLRNTKVMEDIFPRHKDELMAVYNERVKRAFYENNAAPLLGFIASNVASEELRVTRSKDAPVPEWYENWFKDVTKKGGERTTFTSFIEETLVELMVAKYSFIRVGLPDGDSVPKPESQDQQDKAGLRDAFLVRMPIESIRDYELSDSGELLWLCEYGCKRPRMRFDAGREVLVETWTIYTQTHWAVYQLQRRHDVAIDPEADIQKVKEAEHTYGVVPIVRHEMKNALWAMNLLEGFAREHFNKRVALGWAEFQSLFAELYEFLGPEAPPVGGMISDTQTDPGRARSQRRGQGYVQERGSQDSAAYVGPPVDAFDHARTSCEGLVESMARVLHLMAQSAKNNATALGRSAESKKEDRSASVKLFEHFGSFMRNVATDVLRMVARARGEFEEVESWNVHGMSVFEEDTIDAVFERAAVLTGILTAPKINSPTFQRRFQKDLVAAWVRRRHDKDELKKMEDEIEKNPVVLEIATNTEDETDEDGTDEEGLTDGTKSPSGAGKSGLKANG